MKKQKFTYADISTLCLELALFLHAGADPSSGLVLLADETKTTWMKNCFLEMASGIDNGSPLSDAFEQTDLFPSDVCNMIRVGEKTGRVEESLRALSSYYDRRDSMDRQLRSALLYPSVLMMVMLTVIVVLLTKVLPIFSSVYSSLGGQMTGIAGGLLKFGELLNSLLPLLCVVLGIAAIFIIAFATVQSFREKITSIFTKSRNNKGLSKKMITARFAEALSMSICSGLTTTEAVKSAALLLSDAPSAVKRSMECIEKLENGEPLSNALHDTELLPSAECRLLTLGQASGSAETAAAEIAHRLAREAEDALERRISFIEPIMVVATSVLVGMILLTVMLPLTHIMTAIG